MEPTQTGWAVSGQEEQGRVVAVGWQEVRRKSEESRRARNEWGIYMVIIIKFGNRR